MAPKRRSFIFGKTLKNAAVGVVLLAQPAFAENDKPTTEIGLYGFATAINGTTTLRSVVSDVSVPFSDLLENLDMAVMGYVEHRRGRLSFIGDLFYANLSSGNSRTVGPGGTVTSAVTIKQTILETFVAYRLYDEIQADSSGWSFDVLGGLRYNKLDVQLDASAAGAGAITTASRRNNANWVDAVIGVRGEYDFGNGWGVLGWADVGAGKDSNSYQVRAMGSYTFTNNVKVFGGYRLYHFDYDNGSATDYFAVDLDYDGPVIGVSYTF